MAGLSIFLVAGAGYVTNLMASSGYESGNCNNSDPTVQTVSELIELERQLFPKADVQILEKAKNRRAAFGQKRTFVLVLPTKVAEHQLSAYQVLHLKRIHFIGVTDNKRVLSNVLREFVQGNPFGK